MRILTVSSRLCICLGLSTVLSAQSTVRSEAILKGGDNKHYTGNRTPLLPSPLQKLPLGAVKPDGWLRRQLSLMADGFSGHLSEISQFCKYQGNGWADAEGHGQNGWEEVPYWLRGYYDLGMLVGDQRIQSEAKRWLEAVLASQRPSGYFGSEANLQGDRGSPGPDVWPNMVMLYPLRSMYEATGDKRVLPFMLKYFKWQTTVPLDQFMPSSWQHWRGGDNLDSIYWLYNQTGETWLLELARANHERTADWTTTMPTWHVVNIAQCFREPGQYYQQTRDPRYLKATERVWETVRGAYGQVPGGMYGADENARPGFTGPRQGTETCAFAEVMYSDEMLTAITGDGRWADHAEEVAFNSLPASMTADLKALHYLTAPNQVQLDVANKSPWIANGGDMFSYNPNDYRCCQHNVAFAWPYFTERLWMAAAGNGLAAVFYAPSEVKAKVGDGTAVTIKETTSYPFDESIRLDLATARPVRFPLTLRIPGWCVKPLVRVNGKQETVQGDGRGWIVIDRVWSEKDRVDLQLPMSVKTTVYAKNRNTISVERGPLTYSLKIGERWQKKGGTDAWPGWEAYPTTPWNYGLLVDEANPESSLRVEKRSGPLATQPFAAEDAPIVIHAKGKRIPQWGLEANGIIGEVQPGPVRSNEPAEDILLIPMGAARLRISAFPQIGEGPNALVWKDTVPIVLASAASYLEPPSAVTDGLTPPNSADTKTPRFLWPFDQRRAEEWIEFRYSRPQRMGSVEVYWVDDEAGRGNPVLPSSWRVEFWDGTRWQAAPGAPEYEIKKDGFSRAQFTPVETTRLRMVVQLKEQRTAGIFECRLAER